jgi:hypothetical protein
MSQFYDLASLVVIPSGYKASTIYAQKPLTTDGQLSFSRASTATRVNASGLIEAVASNVPRLDYLGSSCPRLLLEPQRTNLVTFSEQIDNAAWSKTNCTISANAVTSPDGYQNADNIVTAAANSDVGRLTATVAADTTTYTQSGFFKWVSGYELVKFRIALAGGTAQGAAIVFNARTGAFVSSDTTYKIENYGNGWFRVSHQITNNGTNTALITQIYPTNETTQTQTISAWGFGMEAGSYLTSYVKTEAAAVTRVADAASKTGISSLIGQTEGVLFVDFTINALANFGTPISVNDGSTSNYIWLTIFANGNLRAELNNGTVQSAITYAGAVVGGRYKMAFGYKTNDFALYVNGAQIGTDNSGTTFSGTTLSRVDTNITNAAIYSTASESISQSLLFKTRLTNAQLAELTTL